LLSFANGRSPCKTWISTDGWLSTAVVNVSFEGDIKLVNIATGKQGSKYFQVESDNGSVVLMDGKQVYPSN